MRWPQVRAWRDSLRGHPPPPEVSDLSAEGLELAVAVALDALSDTALARVAALSDPSTAPFGTATVVLAGTVDTAAIEWAAVLLGRGTAVHLKHPTGHPGLCDWLVAHASDLPLTASEDRASIPAELVVAMGSDTAIEEIRRSLPTTTRFLPHGHRFSAAYIGDHALPPDPRLPGDLQDPFARVAADAALHDGRGCLSPVVVFTSATDAVDRLAAGLHVAQARWPVGRISAAEGAAIRERDALARVLGAVASGPGWSVHDLPGSRWRPVALPRSLAVVRVADEATALHLLAPHLRIVSTLGTDGPAQPWLDAGITRVCRPGRMQRPPLVRSHDGEDWLRATLRARSIEV